MSGRAIRITAIDALTGKEIAASYFLDGVLVGDATPGAFLFRTFSDQTHIFEAKAQGYSGKSTSVLVPDGGDTLVIPLVMTPVTTTVPIRIQFYPAEDGIEWTLTPGTKDSTDGVSYTGGLSVINQVLTGTQTLTVDDPDYEPKTQAFEVTADHHSFVVSLVRKAPGGQNSPAGATKDTSGIATNPEDLILADDVSEDTYDNSSYQQYFTSSQARLYIGDLFIDEMATIQWGMQQNNVPVFGYCSEFMDAIGRGRSIVQGQLVLNYVHQGYLFAALRRYEKATAGASGTSQVATTLSKLIRAAAVTTTTPDQQAQVAARTADLMQGATPTDIQQTQASLRRPASADPYKANPVYRHSIFDMRLEIGDGPYKTVRMLEKCKLGVNEMLVHAQSGEPIAESYTFTARRAR